MDKDHTWDDQVGLASVNAADVLTTRKITEGWYFYILSTSHSTYFNFFFKVGMI